MYVNIYVFLYKTKAMKRIYSLVRLSLIFSRMINFFLFFSSLPIEKFYTCFLEMEGYGGGE